MRTSPMRNADRSWAILLLTLLCWLAVTISWVVAIALTPAKARGAESPVAAAAPAGAPAPAKAPAPLPEAIAPLPQPVTSFGAAVLDDHLYVLGGHTGDPHDYSSASLAQGFHRINLKSPVKWESLPATRKLQGLAVVAHGTAIYRVGGLEPRNAADAADDLHSVAEVARFDVRTGKWEDCTPLPEPRSSHDAVVVGDDLIVVGGWAMSGKGVQGQWHRTVWAANLTKWPLKWRPLAETPFERRAISVAAADGKVIVIGGLETKGATSNAVAVLDLETNQWSEGAPFPGGNQMKGFGSSAFAIGDAIYANGWGTQVMRYDIKQNQWSPLETKLKSRRFFHRLVAHGSDLLVIAGARTGGQLDDVERLPVR